MFNGEKYLTRLTVWQCCHGGKIIFMPNEAAAASYKAAAAGPAAACPTPAGAAARAAYTALGTSALTAAAGAVSPLPARMDTGNVVTKEDLINRAVVVMCPAPKPCVQVVAVHPPALSKCTKVHHKMTQAGETPVLDIIRTLALAGSLCDGFAPPGFVSWIVENQYSADELPAPAPEVLAPKKVLAVTPASEGVLDTVRAFQPALMPPPPVLATSEDCPKPQCAIQAVDVTCKHGRAAQKNRLQVVANRYRETQNYVGVLGVKVEIKKQWGYEDKINVKVKAGHAGMEEASFGGGSWKPGASHTFDFKDTRAETEDKWLIKATGDAKMVAGRSRCHGSSIATRVECFPSPKYSYTLAVEFGALAAILEGNLLKYLWNRLKKNVGDSLQGEKVKEYPKQEGIVTAAWGWEEEREKEPWRCYYDVKVGAGARAKFKKDYKWSLTHLILPVWGLLVKHVADLYLLVGYEVTISLVGQPHGKFYSTGEEKIVGELEFKVNGYVRAGPGFRLGSDYILSVAVEGTVKILMETSAKLELSKSGLKGKAEAKVPEGQLNVRITTKMFQIEAKRKEYTWIVFQRPEPFWKDELQLLPPKSAPAAGAKA